MTYFLEMRELPSGQGAALIVTRALKKLHKNICAPQMPMLFGQKSIDAYVANGQAVASDWGLVTRLLGDDLDTVVDEFTSVAGGKHKREDYVALFSGDAVAQTVRLGDVEAFQTVITPARSVDDRILGDVAPSPTLVLHDNNTGALVGALLTVANSVFLLKGSEGPNGTLMVDRIVTSNIMDEIVKYNIYPDAMPDVALKMGLGGAPLVPIMRLGVANDKATKSLVAEDFFLVHKEPYSDDEVHLIKKVPDSTVEEILSLGQGGLVVRGDEKFPVTDPKEVTVSRLPMLTTKEAIDHFDDAAPPREVTHSQAHDAVDVNPFFGQRIHVAISPADEPTLREATRRKVEKVGAHLMLAARNADLVIYSEAMPTVPKKTQTLHVLQF